MTINFGVLPARCSFTLSSDADFFQTVRTSDGSDFPVTANLEIRWLDIDDLVIATWTATVTDDTAEFREDATDVATVLDDAPVFGRVFYDDGASGPTLLVAEGTVRNVSP